MPAALDPDLPPKRLNIVAPEAWVARVEEWRRNQPKIPNLSEAIRQLVDAGLDAGKKGKKR